MGEAVLENTGAGGYPPHDWGGDRGVVGSAIKGTVTMTLIEDVTNTCGRRML